MAAISGTLGGLHCQHNCGVAQAMVKVSGCSTPCCYVPRKPQCQIPTSRQKCWIASSTTDTTHKMHLGTAASSLNHGSRAPGHTFSPTSGSPPQRAWNYGKKRFQILRPLLRGTPKPCPSTVRLQMRKRVAGSEIFLASSTWRWVVTSTSTRR